MEVVPAFTFLLVATLGLSVLFLGYCLSNRERRGAASLVVMFVGVGIWVGSDIVQIVSGPTPEAWGGIFFRLLGVEVTVIGILLLGLEYTGRTEYIDRRILGLLAIEPLLVLGLAASPYQHLLFETVVTEGTLWGYELVPGPIWLAHVLYSYVLVYLGLGLLAHMMWRAKYGYRLQILAILSAILVPFVGNVLFNTGLIAVDVTPVSFLFTAVVLMYATFRLQLMDAIPVARRTVLDEMGEMVFVLDERGRITMVNDAVTEVFGARGYLVGSSIDSVLETSAVGDPDVEQVEEFTIEPAEETRQYAVTKSVIRDYRDNVLAQTLVCRDVTEQRRRKEQIELLKDVQSRFLRHNLRNELNTILAHADMMRTDSGLDREESYEVIVETAERLVQWGEKAQTIEQLVETTEYVRYPLSEELNAIVDAMQTNHPGVEFESTVPPDVWIETVPEITHAIENLIDNAARYNSASEPYVRVDVNADDETVSVVVEDNGPGIHDGEITAIQNREETPLQHGSGFGLWLVYWVVVESGGDVTFDTDDGTIVTLTFDSVPAEETSSTP